MRAAIILSLILPFPAIAADIPVTTRVSAATVFPQGATISRFGTFSASAGTHQLIITDVPNLEPNLRVEIQGAKMGALTTRTDYVPPRTPQETAALKAARDKVKLLEGDLRSARDAIGAIRAEAQAAKARIAFLTKIGDADGLANVGIETLRDLSRMLGEETLSAERSGLDAGIRARDAEAALKDLQRDLANAKQALAALDLEKSDRGYLAISIDAAADVQGEITIRYMTWDAGWHPVYDVRLDRHPDPRLTMERGVMIGQATGENWNDVALTLSTARPSEQTDPSQISPDLKRIMDKPPVSPRTMTKMSDDQSGLVASPMVVAETAGMSAAFDGLNVTYSYPTAVDIATGADHLRLSLGVLEMTPQVFAKAVPMRDSVAYLMAGFTNDTGELILPGFMANYYLDGTFVRQGASPMIATGDDVEFSFGPIEGIRLDRTRDRDEGDKGVISRSNRIDEAATITVRNLTGEDWDLRLFDRVPYSEQEDLEITWKASPMPSDTDVDGRKGILAWDIPLSAGATETVELSHRIIWPTEKLLR
ncbi:MAG: DUF4139 domain-containing protein [Pseudooceanicola sp.]